MEYSEFFSIATDGLDPYPFQQRLAEAEELPDLLRIPTGLGKTEAAVLAWMWRYFEQPEFAEETPRRLIYCLPMRVLVEQTHDRVETMTENLRDAGVIDLEEPEEFVHMLMGGDVEVGWEIYPERPGVFIGTQDMLLSRALNRGYARTRFQWPVEFGLLNNDALWVLDEVQLMDSGLATTTQLQAFREKWNTYGPTNSIWMSATCQLDWLNTPDYRPDSGTLTLTSEDKSNPNVKPRIRAEKSVQKVDLVAETTANSFWSSTFPEEVSSQITGEFDRWSDKVDDPLILCVLNRVDRAVNVYQRLQDIYPSPRKLKEERERLQEEIDDPDSWARRKNNGDLYKRDQKKLQEKKDKLEEIEDQLEENDLPETTLLHSRFRPKKREELNEKITSETPDGYGGRIIVATQVVEAGVDISANSLITDAAPPTSLVQRIGRLNRYGEHDQGRCLWIPYDLDFRNADQLCLPYDIDRVVEGQKMLERLTNLSPARLTEEEFPRGDIEWTIRKRDLKELFSTDSDLSGNVVDVSPYVRDVEERDVQVYWRNWDRKSKNDAPPEEMPAPGRKELCSAPISNLSDIYRRFWYWDALEDGWRRPQNTEEISPGQTLLLHSKDGFYDDTLGWNPETETPVEPVDLEEAGTDLKENDGTSKDEISFKSRPVTIFRHSEDVKKKVGAIFENTPLEGADGDLSRIVKLAGLFHDLGKSHDIFQDYLKGDGAEDPRLMAKSPGYSSRDMGRKYFRHELASAMYLFANLNLLTDRLGWDKNDPRLSLLIYLVGAHHGKVRTAIRSLPQEPPPDEDHKGDPRLWARGVWDGDELPELTVENWKFPPTQLNLEPITLGSSKRLGNSWIERVKKLREDEEFGPFRLAYLEGLLRAADRRVSASYEEAKSDED